MANQEHLDLLKQGVAVWNIWREKYPDVRPDLSSADLSRANLNSINFRKANLSYVILIRANLMGASLSETSLSGADLSSADLQSTDLYRATLDGVNLENTNLSYARLIRTNLSGAKLIGSDLWRADLSDANLGSADLTEAHFYCTIFAEVDLSNVKGLERTIHLSRSFVDINTVVFPKDETTRLYFLRGVGFTETQIEYLPSLLTPRPIEYSSLFISYAHQDEAIAKRLHADLRKNDVPCWFAPHDMKIGDKIRPRIDEAIHHHDKLLLTLSKHSVASQWVEHEVETALGKEYEGQPNVLFPIRLDDAVMKSTTGWASHVRLTRHIGDFTNWQNDEEYQKAFSRLLRDLKVSRPPTV